MTEERTGRIASAKDGRIGRLVIDNERRRNALTFDMWLGIPPAVSEFIQDPEIRVIVVSGAGEKAFAAGADVSQFETQRSSEEQAKAYADAVAGACDALENAPKPTIAMIRGACYGGGVGLALSCDLRIGADDARLAITAAKLGIGYPYDGLRRLVHLVGPSRAKEIMFTAEPLAAEEALRIGLLDRVVPAEGLADFVGAYVGRMAKNAPLSLAAAKLCIDLALKPETEQDLAACRAAVEACMASADYVEGRRAFIEKRPAAFRGV